MGPTESKTPRRSFHPRDKQRSTFGAPSPTAQTTDQKDKKPRKDKRSGPVRYSRTPPPAAARDSEMAMLTMTSLAQREMERKVVPKESNKPAQTRQHRERMRRYTQQTLRLNGFKKGLSNLPGSLQQLTSLGILPPCIAAAAKARISEAGLEAYVDLDNAFEEIYDVQEIIGEVILRLVRRE
jgi:hypothetical protein